MAPLFRFWFAFSGRIIALARDGPNHTLSIGTPFRTKLVRGFCIHTVDTLDSNAKTFTPVNHCDNNWQPCLVHIVKVCGRDIMPECDFREIVFKCKLYISKLL